ncbi:MAG: acetate--CoA ligase [Chlamydiales bacterium]|nr:acetate--CoA ligase [Chlamydiales bacterium]
MGETKNIGAVDVLLKEDRVFAPSPSFIAQANVRDNSLYEQAANDREGFWAECAKTLDWFRPWDKVVNWEPPYAQWFLGGKLNACYNCVDRHIHSATRNKAAITWEGELGEQRTLTYWDLYREVCKLANVLKSRGVAKGDRVAIYLPMVPEAIISLLACARIGAIHTVVFGGFSADSLRDRMLDAEAKVLITADGGYRRGNIIHLKQMADKALQECPKVQDVIVVRRTGRDVDFQEGRDHWYHDLMHHAEAHCPPEPMDAEDTLFILYTSGTTGKPKGIMHSTGGYLVGVAATHKWVFDIKPEDVYWCTADVGWITGHSYVTYGPLANGASQIIFEGTPDWPERDRFWRIIEKYGVTVLYTTPTAIRTFMKWGTQWPENCNLSSLRLLGTVGEPINPEAWIWYQQHIGGNKCPIVDTWWQTETGAIVVAPLPGVTPTKPGSATKPLPGMNVAVLNDQGQPITSGGGYLALTAPIPSMLRGIWKDYKRYEDTYFSKWNTSTYFTGDGCRSDDDGYLWMLGRVDDVMNVSGHRIGSMEIESALVAHPAVAEAAVVGIDDEIKGQAIVGFVILKEGQLSSRSMEEELREHVAKSIGAIARPHRILFTRDLPKTRSGKIMRRLLRDIAEGRVLGDVTTLADVAVVEDLKQKYEEEN